MPDRDTTTDADHSDESRWAWVIGGTGGIGQSIVSELVADGWHVVASGRSLGSLHSVGPRHWAIGTDVTNDEALRVAFSTIVDHAGRLDAVVVATRTPGQGTFLTMPDALWQEAIDTKLLGFVRVARHVLPELERTRGSLVSMVGSAATFASAGHPLGCINAALRHAVRGLALEWSPKGVRVLGISPGPTATPSLAGLMDEQAAALGVRPSEVEADVAGSMFRKQLLRPEEIAKLVAFAIGPHGALLNGTVMLADDGATGGTL